MRAFAEGAHDLNVEGAKIFRMKLDNLAIEYTF